MVDTIKPAAATPLAQANNSPNPDTGSSGNAGPLASAGRQGSSLNTDSAEVPIDILFADVAPDFPGGMERFYTYLKSHLVYSSMARDAGVSGRIYVTFVVGSDGKVKEVKILKGLGYGLDEQVLAVLAKSPAWNPGIWHGKPVATILRLPVNFQMMQ